ASVARRERTLSAEHHGQNALVLGRVDAGRTQTLRLAERERLPVHRSLNARVLHVNCETEASHRIPVGHSTHGPVVEAGVATATTNLTDVLASAEQSTVDDAVAVANL